MSSETMKLRKHNDPALSTVCEPLQLGDDLSFLADMREVCERENGVGLAAPQIGVLKRAVYIWPNRKGGLSLYMLNPTIVARSITTATESEGCLSYPGVWTPVERHLGVTVEYADLDFVTKRCAFSYYAARVVQHEIEHLDGVCRVGDAWRAQETREKSAALAVIGMARRGLASQERR